MRKITATDIQEMLQKHVQESLKVTAGKGKNQKILISPGFKIMHKKSGLTYTVKDVLTSKGKIILVAVSGDGNAIEIHHGEFKQYEGL
jgi:hypothetical protein